MNGCSAVRTLGRVPIILEEGSGSWTLGLAVWAHLTGYNEIVDQTRLLAYGQLKLGDMNPTPKCISSLSDLIVP